MAYHPTNLSKVSLIAIKELVQVKRPCHPRCLSQVKRQLVSKIRVSNPRVVGPSMARSSEPQQLKAYFLKLLHLFFSEQFLQLLRGKQHLNFKQNFDLLKAVSIQSFLSQKWSQNLHLNPKEIQKDHLWVHQRLLMSFSLQLWQLKVSYLLVQGLKRSHRICHTLRMDQLQLFNVCFLIEVNYLNYSIHFLLQDYRQFLPYLSGELRLKTLLILGLHLFASLNLRLKFTVKQWGQLPIVKDHLDFIHQLHLKQGYQNSKDLNPLDSTCTSL